MAEKTIRLTMAQALVKYLTGLTEHDSGLPLFGGCWAIFGHGNVAGLGEALYQYREQLPTLRAHNEQAMAHSAIAYAKAHFRRRMMAVTTSIGPGATNLLTAAALANVNRLPVLLLPGDTFTSRAPDPVLQQLEHFSQGDASVNDAFRPLSRYFDRIDHPAQLLDALPKAIAVLTDPAQCGPVTLALPQDVQAQAFDYPESFFAPKTIRIRRPAADALELAQAVELLKQAKRPLIVAGGGVLYSQAGQALSELAQTHGIPVVETQGGKSAVPWNHPLNLGSIGVTGSPAANELANEADVVLAVGSRLQDFTTGSRSVFAQARLIALNVQMMDAHKWHAHSVVADALVGLNQMAAQLQGWQSDAAWRVRAEQAAQSWQARIVAVTQSTPHGLPYDAHCIGAVQSSSAQSMQNDIVVCAAGTLPAELHKLWRTETAGGYHMEYGYSCMGYEIAGGLGVKMAHPEREVIVMVGDGSYMMMNSEIATSVMLGQKLIIVVQDNRGYGCINRLQQSCGSPSFNNMLDTCVPANGADVPIDFAAHAASMGAIAKHVHSVDELKAELIQARANTRTTVLVIDTNPNTTTADGGSWWEVAVPEVSSRSEVNQAHARYMSDKQNLQKR